MIKLGDKRGQGIFGLSYGAIFSIFVIGFILAVAIFAINHFLSLNACAQVGFYRDDLAEEIEKAWSGTAGSHYDDYFNGTLPQGGLFGLDVEKVCFGKLSQDHTGAVVPWTKLDEFAFLNRFSGDENLFIYPPKEACGGDMAGFTIRCRGGNSECMTTDKFFCVNVEKGKVGVVLRKGRTETLVKLSKN